MKLTKRKSRKVFINITSLIDVLFLLLIFFMVSSTFEENPVMELELPESESATVQELKDLVLQVNAEGKMLLNSKETTLAGLKALLEEEHEKNRSAALILKADKNVTHGETVKIMDLANQVGIPRIVFSTKDKD